MKLTQIHILLCLIGFSAFLFGQSDPIPGEEEPEFPSDTTIIFNSPRPLIDITKVKGDYKNSTGLKVGFSSYGFSLGGFYQRKLNDNLQWNTFTLISQAMAGDEIMQIDPRTLQQFIPNKINRLLFIPLMTGLRLNLFQDKIVNTFKPFIGAGGGIGLILSSPYREGRRLFDDDGNQTRLVGFFEAFGDAVLYGRPGGYVEFGAEFNNGIGAYSSLNIRYYYVPFGGDGLESVVRQPITTFGQFFISLNIGKKF